MHRRKALAIASTSALALFSGGAALAAGMGVVGRTPAATPPMVEAGAERPVSNPTGGVVTSIETVFVDDVPISDSLGDASAAPDSSRVEDAGAARRADRQDGQTSADDPLDDPLDDPEERDGGPGREPSPTGNDEGGARPEVSTTVPVPAAPVGGPATAPSTVVDDHGNDGVRVDDDAADDADDDADDDAADDADDDADEDTDHGDRHGDSEDDEGDEDDEDDEDD